MKTEINKDSVFINGVEYAPINQLKNEVSTDGLPYVMIRTYSSGVHFGYLQKRESTLAGIEVTLIQAQRMRQWAGAMDLSQLAMEGSKKPEECKPSVIVNSIELVAIEIIPITEIAAKQLKSMKIWKV
jgi:hypothetical protein